jgi:hypothetical protein
MSQDGRRGIPERKTDPGPRQRKVRSPSGGHELLPDERMIVYDHGRLVGISSMATGARMVHCKG